MRDGTPGRALEKENTGRRRNDSPTGLGLGQGRKDKLTQHLAIELAIVSANMDG
jgi:hypothetical protein